jgi:alpha-N-arabinofuranosidase
MKTRIALFAAAAFCLGSAVTAAAQEAAPRVPDQLNVTINTQQTADPVSKYVFGSFIEHIGGTIYRSVWAELLDDRKFWFPINSKEDVLPPGQNAAQRQRMALRKWRPVGPDDAITMDKENPFVGEQSPSIQLDASTPHGIKQAGIALVKGKTYTGRIWLKGAAGSKITVSLIWGDGASDKQTVTIPAITAEYKKFPLSFTAKADAANATLEIAGTGSGSFHIGTVSLMPSDNVQGFRPDTIALLRQMHSGMWRLPGGNFLSDWMWYDAIGDVDKRPPMFDHAWNAMQVNDVGMDEFMTLCKLIDVDPYVTVNGGFGDSHSAAEEVEYLNGSVNTRLGALRAKNGHPEPYHIKYWNIGNEPWGTFQMGYTDIKYWVLKNNEFAKAMLKVDPSIVLIGSGKMLEPMMLRGEERAKYVDNLSGAYLNSIDWTGGMMAHSFGTFQGMAQHWYEGAGRHFDIQKAKALPITAVTGEAAVAVAPTNSAMVTYEPTTLEYARYAGDIIRRHAEEWQGYLDRFPAAREKKIFLSIDEYSYGGGGGGGRGGPNLKSALAYGMLLNEWMRHTDYLTMGARTMGTSALDITPTASTYNTVGLTYKMYGEQFPGTIPVELSGNSPQPATNPNYADEPKVRSGSPTYPLDLFAALTPDKKNLVVSVVNATDKDQKFDLSVTGSKLAGPSKAWILSGSNLDAANRVGEPAQVQVKETSLASAPSSITVAPYTVSIYRFPVAAK